jgi:hypothetical protein
MTGGNNMAQSQSQAIRTFVLGNKEIEGKTVEFQYDHGWYSICDILGEQRNIVYKSRNAQEAYMKWNVYIGRKKERPQRNAGGDEQRAENSSRSRQNQNRTDRGSRDDRTNREERDSRDDQNRSRTRNRSENRSARQEHSHQNQRRHSRNNRQNRE